MRAFKNGVLRRVFGPRAEDMTGKWRKLHSEEPNGLYSPQNTIWVIELRRMIWEGHVARMRKGEVYARFWWGNLTERTTWKM